MYNSPLKRKKRFPFRVAVHTILIRDGHVLLLRRANTGWGDGCYTVPAGHLDGKESVIDATIRECQEEVGITPISPDFACIIHCRSEQERDEYHNYFFVSRCFKGEAQNLEPNKCDHVAWFPIHRLPENTLPFVKKAIFCHLNGIRFSPHLLHGPEVSTK